jgi:PAS domain-containing protein
MQARCVLDNVRVWNAPLDKVGVWNPPNSIFAVTLDVTERKRVEEALRAAQARVDFAIRASNIGIWAWIGCTTSWIKNPGSRGLA